MQEQLPQPRFSDEVRGWLQPALDHSGTHDIEDIESEVVAGRFQLWVGANGAAITEVTAYPKKRVFHIFLAGGNMEQMYDFLGSFWTWAQMQGCTEMTLSGRKGWTRALANHGWKDSHINMRFKP